MNQLEQDNVGVIPAESGELASGLEGTGRMAEPETILEHIEKYFEVRFHPDLNKLQLF